ncbi:MAG: sulfatase [Defluviitaleaceae bacterium]|nr:sulfatase [Defluviitaleaceae bacterium]
MKKPNVVFLISHDTGKFYSPYGIKTVDNPNFEKFAAEAVTFDRCFCTTPLCSPARSALTTGRYPHQNGMNGLPGDTLGRWDMIEKDRHLASVFSLQGYKTVLCGVYAHETVNPASVGFAEHINDYGSGNIQDSVLLSAGAIENWLGNNPGAGTKTPFYMQIVCAETHRDWENYCEPYGEKGVWKAPYLIDSPDIDNETKYMQGCSNQLDRGLGMIMDVFGKHGLTDETIFVITTDHGLDYPRAKGTLFDPGVEVGLFMRYGAGCWQKGVRCGLLASHVDVYATVLDACGISAPAGTAGISFLHALLCQASSEPIRDAVFLEKTYHDNYDPMRGIRTDRYKYIVNFDAQTLYDVRVATAPRYNWFRFPYSKNSREELYDLANDPNETKNLANEPGFADICKEFKKRLAKWMAQTDDKLLEGAMPSPYHVRISAEMKNLASE